MLDEVLLLLPPPVPARRVVGGEDCPALYALDTITDDRRQVPEEPADAELVRPLDSGSLMNDHTEE